MHKNSFIRITAAACLAAILISVCGCFSITVHPPKPTEAADETAVPTEAVIPDESNSFATAHADFIFAEGTDPSAFDAGAAADALDRIAALPGFELPKLTVYVEPEIDRGSYIEGTDIHCTQDDLDTCTLYALAAHSCDTGLPDWAERGAAYIAKNGNANYNPIKLGAVLNDDGIINTLALLQTRFARRFNKSDALGLAYRTAGALLHYVMQKHGGEIDLADIGQDKAAFIEELGLAEVYEGKYEGLLDDCEVLFDHVQNDMFTRDQLFPMVVMSDTYTLFAQPLVGCSNANELEAFLYKLQVGKQQMREFIEQNSSDNIDACDFEGHTNYYLLNEYGNSYAQGHNVVLKLEAGAVLHETIHQWIMPRGYDHWYYEGLADFLALQGGEGESLSFVNSMARLAFMHPDVYGGGGVADYNGTPASERVPGDEFTYDQSCSLIAYICGTYTLDPILAVCKNTGTLHFERDFEQAFGVSYDEVISGWKEWLGVD